MLAAAGAAIAAVIAMTGAATAGPVRAGTAQPAGAGGPAGTTRPFGITDKSKTGLLLNGDRLAVTGTSVAIAMAGNGFAAAVTELRLGGRRYAIPDAALPFLGRGLDLSLFDVAALPGDGTLPVRIGYRGKTPRLPGVTITRAGGGVAAGFLTAASAKTFGEALTRQLSADHGRASYGSDGLFAGGVSVSLAAGGLPPPPVPQFPMHVLTVRGLDLAGQPDTGDVVYLLNSDNNAFFGDPYEAGSLFYHGTAKYSVPAGHYWALGDFITFGSRQQPVGEHIVLDPAFTVTGNASVTIDARSATGEVTFATPKPASLANLLVELVNTDKVGNVNAFTFGQSGGVPLWISPTTRRPAAGTLREYVSARLIAAGRPPPRPGTGPTAYYLTMAGSAGVIGSQRFTVAASGLATVRAGYSSDVPATGGLALFGVLPAQLQLGLVTGFVYPMSVPARQVEYLTAGPQVYWLGWYFQSYSALAGGQMDSFRTFVPGTSRRQSWNRYPLHSTLNSYALGGNDPGGAFLSATRAGDVLTLSVNPFSDDTAGHSGWGFQQGLLGNVGTISGSYQILENGTKIAAGNAVQGTPGFSTQATLSARPSAIAFTLNASRTGWLYPLSTATTTTWTWRSASRPVTTLPPGWFCADGVRACAVEPLLTLRYAVAGIALDGTAPAGAQVVRISAGHQQFAAAPRVRKVAAWVSFDDGATWSQVPVTGRGQTRYAVFAAPSGSYVSIRVTAADAAGGSVSETITRAYATAAQAAPGYRPACLPAGPDQARCLVLYSPAGPAARAGAAGFGPVAAAAAATVPAGWGARDIERAYQLPVGRNPRQTVAVVEAFDTPRLETYLNTYRREYGLPPCTAENGCFRKVGQDGSARQLPADGTGSGWDLEATLDADMVSAACPRCRILVVEAAGADLGDLAAAANTAVRLGAAAVSNSYGARETGAALVVSGAYRHPGHAIVASTGDLGYTAASFPADLGTVTAVGGTELATARNARGWRETAWNEPGAGAGSSGCSAYVAKPRWQHDADCPGRTVADVAALAWNVAIFEGDWGGWLQVGGTSASAPIVAGVFGLAGNAARVRPGYEYAHSRSLFDVTSGNNDWFYELGGAACGYDYLCVARPGYDGPTGLGTPDGVGAF